MGNYEQLKSEVSNVIKTNGTQSITGQIMQNVLLTIISTIGENATFAGIAEPTTIPGTPDGNLFYIAYEKGIYANFNSIDITDDDGLVILLYSSDWSKINIPLASKDELALLRSDLNNINTDDIKSKLGNKYIAETKTASDMQGIYWFTPIVRWLDYNETTGSGTDAQWSDVYSVTGNGTLKEFSAKIQNEVVLNHIPVCDMYNSLGWNKYNFKNYFVGSDGTHPRPYNGVTCLAKKNVAIYFIE